MRVIITGIHGFVGRHIASIARSRGHHVIGVTPPHNPPRPAVEADDIVEADLTVAWPRGLSGDAVIHLAGLAAIGRSFDAPTDYIGRSSAISINIGEALLQSRTPTRLVAVSSGAVYGASSTPIDEASAIDFSSPYVVSKVLMENIVAYYRNRRVDGVIARPFNHIGPGQATGFIVPDLVAAIRAAPPGEPIVTGNLATRRDYTDVRDVARAYLALAEAPALAHARYNVATGAARSGAEVLDAVCAALGVAVPGTRSQPGARPIDAMETVGDASRLRGELGWHPTVGFEQSIRDFVAAQTVLPPLA